MSIFDSNIHHPLEDLLKEITSVIKSVVPRELCHYNDAPEHIKYEIVEELRHDGCLFNPNKPINDQIHRAISLVSVTKDGYLRGIPYYKINVQEVDWNDSGDYYFPYFVCIYAGIGGIIKVEPISY